MENTGTWNSDEAILFFAAMVFPIVMYFFAEFLKSIRGANIAHVHDDTDDYDPPQPKINPTINITTNKYYSSPKKVKQKPKRNTKKTVPSMVNNLACALVRLGYRKKEALNLAQSAVENNSGASAEELLSKCLKQ